MNSKHLTLIYTGIFTLGILGLVVSSYLAYEYSQPKSITCPIGGFSCNVVRNSAHSKILGISVPLLGIFFYSTLSIITLIIIEKASPFFRKLLLLWTGIGFGFSLYFTYLEAFVIYAFCFWCVVSALLSSLIFILSIGASNIISRQNHLSSDTKSKL